MFNRIGKIGKKVKEILSHIFLNLRKVSKAIVDAMTERQGMGRAMVYTLYQSLSQSNCLYL